MTLNKATPGTNSQVSEKMPVLGTEHLTSRNPSSSGNEPTLRSQADRPQDHAVARKAVVVMPTQPRPDEMPEVPSQHDFAADQKGTENVVTHDPNGICLSISRNASKPGQPTSNDHPTVIGRKLGSRDALYATRFETRPSFVSPKSVAFLAMQSINSSPGPSLLRGSPMIQDLGPKASTCQAELKTMVILTAPRVMSSDAPTFLTRNFSTMNPTSPYSPWQA